MTRRLDTAGAAAEPVAWRAARLRSAGLDDRAAARIADDARYDVHALLELVDSGCPAELAARIVAPLEERGR